VFPQEMVVDPELPELIRGEADAASHEDLLQVVKARRTVSPGRTAILLFHGSKPLRKLMSLWDTLNHENQVLLSSFVARPA